MSNIQVRGCCCGIPFGCGTLVLVLLLVFLGRLFVPEVRSLPLAGLWESVHPAKTLTKPSP